MNHYFLDLRIANQHIGILCTGIPSNKCHFMLTLRMTNIVIWMIGKLPSFTKQYEVGSFWQYEVGTFQPNALNERDVALFCRLALSSLLVFIFSGLTYYIYCSAFIFTITTRVLIILLYPNILIVVLIITIIKFYT